MFKTLSGFREFYPEDLARRDYVFAKWKECAISFGFEEFDPPVLEQLELFTEKSGEEIKSQLFEFVDKGGRAVSLRPEMTPSLARMVGARANGLKRPIKYFAIGENYRYERQQKGRLRAFYQFNADLLGETSISADAEIIALLIDSLKSFGLTENEFKLRLGDRDLWIYFLRMNGIEECLDSKVLSVVDKIEKVPDTAFEEMLVKALEGTNLDALKIKEAIKNFVNINSLEALDEISKNASQDFSKRIGDWKELLSMLQSMGLASYISIDLGIVRGLAYYTGFVFEAFQIVGKGRALAGGGRYDNLVKKLGYPDMPAVGFGMGDVTVSDLLELCNKQGSIVNNLDAYVVIGDESLRGVALEKIFALRRLGKKIDYPLKASAFGKQFKQASSLNAKFAIIFASDEFSQGKVKLKNLATAEEFMLDLGELESYSF
ncbi:MAG: histidine--tRNA ligase [Opitutales bacterium]